MTSQRFNTFNRTVLLAAGLLFFGAPPVSAQTAGPPGGTVNVLRPIASQPGLIYAASGVGLLRSTNGGRSWTGASPGLPRGTVTAVDGPSWRLYAALQNGGVWRSRNGQPFEPAGEGIEAPDVVALAVDPNNPDIVLAGTGSDGAFRSDNGGDGWERPGEGLPIAPVADMAFVPGSSDRILAALVGGLFESLDGGRTWNSVVTGQAAFQRIRFAPGTDTVYVATSQGLIRRDDPNGNFGLVEGFGVESARDIAVDPNDPDTLIAVTRNLGIVRSRNRGDSWSIVGGGLPRTLFMSLRAIPESPVRWLLGAEGTGVFASTDGGDSWTLSSKGFFAADVGALAAHPSDPGLVFAAVDGGGFFRSTDGGETWEEARAGFPMIRAVALKFDPTNPATLYAGSRNPFDPGDGAMSRTGDRGATWETFRRTTPVFDFAIDPADGNRLWLGTLGDQQFGQFSGLLRSTNRGGGFDRVNGGGPGRGVLAGWSIFKVAIDPRNSQNMWVAGFFGNSWNLFWSDNRGSRFQSRLGAQNPPFLAIEPDPQDGRRLFIGTGGVGLIRSSDGGRSDFPRANEGLPNNGDGVTVNSIAFDRDDSRRMLMATSIGAFRSDDGADSWRDATSGLGELPLLDLSAGRDAVYVSTDRAGVFRSRNFGETWEPTGRKPLDTEAIVHAGSFRHSPVAAEQIVSVFGGPFSEDTEEADAVPLPTRLAGASVRVTDSAGVSREAPLFFVSPGQINFMIPDGTAQGMASVTVEREQGDALTAELAVAAVAPGLFTAARTGEGLPAAFGVRVSADGARSAVNLHDGELRAEPIDLGPEGDLVALELFGTGIRGASEVRAAMNGEDAPVHSFGPQPQFVGLDQVNVLIPRTLGAAGWVEIQLVVDGVRSNPVAVFVR